MAPVEKLLPFLLCSLFFFFAAPQLSAQTDYDNLSTSRGKAPPRVGLTREEARKRYGEPFQRVVSAKGERWWYRLKFDEVYGRALLPFMTSSDNIRLGFIEFGLDGRAQAFDWPRSGSQLVQ